MANAYGYSPYTPMYGVQHNQLPVQQQQTQTQQNAGLMTIFVNSEDEVNFYPVAAGLTVMLVSFNMGKFYLKSTGKNGVPEPLRVFSFNEETSLPQIQNGGTFVTRDELDNLSDKLNALIEKLGGDK